MGRRLGLLLMAATFAVAMWAIFSSSEAPTEGGDVRPSPFRTAEPTLVGLGREVEPPLTVTPAGPSGRRGSECSGQVVDARTGRGIAGAWIARQDGRLGYASVDQITRSDQGGYYELDAVPADGSSVFVRANQYLPAVVKGPCARIELSRGVEAYGVTLDAYGMPVSGVEVRVASESLTSGWPLSPGRISLRADEEGGVTISDDRGEWALWGLKADRTYRAWARKDGYFPMPFETSGVAVFPGVRAELHLRGMTTILVSAVDAVTGKIVPTRDLGSQVRSSSKMAPLVTSSYERAVALQPFPHDMWAFRYVVQARARHSPPTTFSVALDARAPGYEPSLERVTAVRGKLTEVRIPLKPLRPLETWGEVLVHAHALDGTQFSGFLLVGFQPAGGGTSSRILSFRSGVSEPVRLPPGGWRIFAMGVEPRRAWWGQPSPPVSVEVGEAPQRTKLDLLLGAVRVTLQVQDEDGMAVRGFGLKIEDVDSPGGAMWEPWDFPESGNPGVQADHPTAWVRPGALRFHIRHSGFVEQAIEKLIEGDHAPQTLSVTLLRDLH